jgi:hypothetical protein
MKTVKPINPWPWSLKLGFDQAQVVEDHQRQLVCSGQDAVDADGNPQHRATWPLNSSWPSTTWRRLRRDASASRFVEPFVPSPLHPWDLPFG